jgi:hypothetical protein
MRVLICEDACFAEDGANADVVIDVRQKTVY